MPNEVPVAFHNGSNYDFHLLMVHLFIKELAKEFEGQLHVLEKYKKVAKNTKHFLFQQKKKSQKLIKMVMNML